MKGAAMRIRRLILGFILSVIFLTTPIISEAGGFNLGVKGWYTIWDSAVLDWFEKNLITDLASLGRTIDASKDSGSGYLLGPLISYQTNDGKWSASLAAMVFSSFSQDWDGSAAGMDMDADVDLERYDIDLALSYSLNKYMWLFIGYKYQDMNMDFRLTYTATMGTITNEYKLESSVHIPTGGVGFVYPITDKLALGLQLGLLYTIPDLTMIDNDGTTYDIWPRGDFGFNGEFNINYRLIDHLIFQLGFRYQHFQLEARMPETWEKIESDDITYGPTLSAIWVF